MIKIAIVEDAKLDLDSLENKLLKYSSENNVEFEITKFDNGLDFLKDFHCNFDIIFMDIEMPKLNGYTAATKIREKDESVILIFITNLTSYVYKGYEVGAMDYILKPVHYPDLSMRLDTCIKKISKNENYSLILNSKNTVTKIECSNILYIESLGHDIIFHLIDNKELTYRGPSMKELEKELKSHGFSRCNHCYIVNLKYIESIEGMSLAIKGKYLEISRSKKATLLNDLLNYNHVN